MTGEEAAFKLKVEATHWLEFTQDKPKLKAICDYVLDDERFVKGYGASVEGEHAHHAFSGGLAVHTYEVLQTAEHIGISNILIVNMPVLVTAAICHDYCKIYDYDKDGRKTKYRNLVRHLSGSHAMFFYLANKFELDESENLRIQHCILAHHGRKEWGSPIEPQTVEAAILHYADMLSMQFGIHKDIKDKLGNIG